MSNQRILKETRRTVKIHYTELNGERKAPEYNAVIVTPGMEDMDSVTCLINTCGEETGFEDVPKSIDDWVDQIGLDYHCFPNLMRTWGEESSNYFFTFDYEIINEHSDELSGDRKVTMDYAEQLSEIITAAKAVAVALPKAEVRILEGAGCGGAHVLEIAFPYPTDAQEIKEAYKVLESSFDYIWDIGQEDNPVH